MDILLTSKDQNKEKMNIYTNKKLKLDILNAEMSSVSVKSTSN